MHNAHMIDRQARHSAEPLPPTGRPVLSERAGAKINLSLHVLGRRADGYHSLESLVVFSGVGDHLRLEPGQAPGVDTHGPYAQAAGPAEENLVLKAEAALGRLVPNMRSGRFTLLKRIPVAAGLGGGSADAAAALRLLARLNGLDSDDARLAEAAAETGSDVTVCLRPRAAMLHDRGERVDRQVEVPPLAAVLVNPRMPLSTPRVFAALKLAPGQSREGAAHCPLPAGTGRSTLIDLLCGCRNDLEDAAAGLEPAVAEALSLLRAAPQTRLARMSGSGATVFALTADPRGACQLAQAIRGARPHWWVRSTVLR